MPVKLAELDDKFIRHMKYAFGIALIGSSRLEILSFIFESEKALLSTRIYIFIVGHFLFSVRTQDMEDLKNTIWQELNLDVALRWRIMQMEETYVKYNDGENAPAAIQILVGSTEVEKAKRLLRQEYATSKTTGYLDGQKMRYIPDCKLLVSSKKKLSYSMLH